MAAEGKPDKSDANASKESSAKPMVLSEGAAIALGNALSRFVTKDGARVKSSGKRPRTNQSPVVLAGDEDVQKETVREREQKAKLREVKRAKREFQSNAHVVPDASTGAALERELLATATRGSVALFNAVAKAQRPADGPRNKEQREKKLTNKKGPALSKENFMDMMKMGLNKPIVSTTCEKQGNASAKSLDEESSDNEEDDDAVKTTAGSSAKWLKDDFLTSGSKSLKDWDRQQPADSDDALGADEGYEEEHELDDEKDGSAEADIESDDSE